VSENRTIRTPEHAVGGRYHLHSHVGRLPLPGGRTRCVQPPHRRLRDGLHTQLVLDALNMALATRRPKDVVHHSDQGSQYASIAFGKSCREAGVRPSMGSVGDAYDNAMAASFFATRGHNAVRSDPLNENLTSPPNRGKSRDVRSSRQVEPAVEAPFVASEVARHVADFERRVPVIAPFTLPSPVSAHL